MAIFVIASPAQNGLVEMDLYHNSMPLFTHWVIRNDYLHEPFVIIDVGVQGGPHPRWEYLGNRAHIYGFDPISEVIESLNTSKGPNQFYRAIALGNEDGERQFKVTPNTYESSFYSSNTDTGTQGGIALGARTVEVRRLDTLFAAGEIPPADYIKLDCEGFEPEVVRGARNYLARSNILCVTTETNFGVSPVYLRTPFVDICEMVSEHRLLVFDLNAVRTARPSYVAARRRRPWPEPDLMRDSPRLDVGQPTTFDFVFCRDFVAEAIVSHHFVTLPGASLAPTVDKLIKSMINFELHGLMDCAVDLAEHFRATLSPRFDVDEAIAHLIGPPPNPRVTADVTECVRMIGAIRTRLLHTKAELERAEQRVKDALRATSERRQRLDIERAKRLPLGEESVSTVPVSVEPSLQAENAKPSNQNAALEARAFEAERTVQDMLASTSWRITSPLRAIRKLLP